MNVEASPEPKWQASWVWLDPVQFPGAQHAPVSWWAGDAHHEGRIATAGLLRRRFTLNEIPAQVRLRPQPLDLDWAQGVVPTLLGDIRIRWERHGTTVALRAAVPDGMAVQAPDGRGETAQGDAGCFQWFFKIQGTGRGHWRRLRCWPHVTGA